MGRNTHAHTQTLRLLKWRKKRKKYYALEASLLSDGPNYKKKNYLLPYNGLTSCLKPKESDHQRGSNQFLLDWGWFSIQMHLEIKTSCTPELTLCSINGKYYFRNQRQIMFAVSTSVSEITFLLLNCHLISILSKCVE